MLTSLHFILDIFCLGCFLKKHVSFLPLIFGFTFPVNFSVNFTPRSSTSEEDDDKEDSAWEPQKKVPRRMKQPVPKESKPKKVKKNNLQINDGSKGMVVKEELVGALAGYRDTE